MPNVRVLIWFDVEDFITPESDDALKGIIDALDFHKVKGTFKLVGEKLRVLKSRGREDIIEALRNHEVGYHTNYHSIHPTPADYLEGLSWEDGIREFVRREQSGFELVADTFGYTPSAGQPGSSWAPQVYGALRDWQIPVYLDETNQIGLDEKPFWYCGIFNVLRLRSNTTRFDPQLGRDGLVQGLAKFDSLYERLRQAGGGLISIWYHPCEYSTYEFWDAVNFSNGNTPSSDEWITPKIKTKEQMQLELQCFRDYVGHIVSQPGVETLTASEAYNLYPDKSKDRMFTLEEIRGLVHSLQRGVTFAKLNDVVLSPAEIFYLAATTLGNATQKKGTFPTFVGLLGPTRRTSSNVYQCSLKSLKEACSWAKQFMDTTGRVPDAIPLPGGSVSPIDFFETTNHLLRSSDDITKIKDSGPIDIRDGKLLLEEQASDENAWGWIIFPKGFSAPNIMELAKLQTWSLKPAI